MMRLRESTAQSFGFQLQVCNNGERGKDADTLSINMSDGHTAANTQGGGNVQLH